MAKITAVTARQILDSRGSPTVEADVILDNKVIGRAAVPAGASTGSHEAKELRDTDKKPYDGKGVTQAVANIKGPIQKALTGISPQQAKVDEALLQLDGTKDKSRLGANAMLAVSLAVAKATASFQQQPLYEYLARLSGSSKPQLLPVPLVNVLNGGAHAKGSTDIQEFMLVPVAARSFSQAIAQSAEVFYALKELVAGHGWSTAVGDEGGFAPAIGSNEQALSLLGEAIERANYRVGEDFMLAIDVAASELQEGEYYRLQLEDQSLNRQQMIGWLDGLREQYPLVSIEDGLGEDDWVGWEDLTARLGKNTQLVGDDLLVTNTRLLKKAIAAKACNAILIKPNQIGTLTETIEAVATAKAAGFKTIVSHRSGETEDTIIAHIAVGLSTGQIKTGSLSRGERTAKYNELLRIEEALKPTASYGGRKVFA